MADKTTLEATPRTVLGKANKRLRKSGFIPANIYGHKEAPMAIQLEALAFDHLRRTHGARNILSLQLPDGAAETVLVRHVQRDPATGGIVHVDFTRVNMRERLELKVPLNFVGEAPGVKVQGGVLLHLLEALAIECAASDIVEHLDVDITPMTDIDSALHAKDVKLPAHYKLLTDPEEPIVKISAPRVEISETAPAEEAPAAASESEAQTKE